MRNLVLPPEQLSNRYMLQVKRDNNKIAYANVSYYHKNLALISHNYSL